MPEYMRGLDCATIITTPYAKKIAAAGFAHVGRYLRSLSKAEVAAIHGAGLGVWLIYEYAATRAFEGAAAGKQDGVRAAVQASALGAPQDAAIYATVDSDVLAGNLQVAGYLAAFGDAIRPRPLGVYACGNVLSRLPLGVTPWLAGAMSWGGSKAYDLTGAWAMKQGPTIQAGQEGPWGGFIWSVLPFDYDPNLIARDIGVWAAPGSAPVIAPKPRPSKPIPLAIDMQEALRDAGFYHGMIDGLFGPQSQAALAAYYGADHG